MSSLAFLSQAARAHLSCEDRLAIRLVHAEIGRGVGDVSGDYYVVDTAGDRSSDNYDNAFGTLLDQLGYSDFSGLVDHRRAVGKGTHFLSLFSSGLFLENADSQTGTRVREPWDYGFAPYPVINGNVFALETWAKIRQSLAEREIETIDVATLRPCGFEYLRPSCWEGEVWPRPRWELPSDEQRQIGFPYLYASVLKRAYQLLTTDEGLLFFQIPGYGRAAFVNWLDSLKTLGLEIERTHLNGRITKSPDSPERLPLHSLSRN